MEDEDIKLGRKPKADWKRKKQKSFTLTQENVYKVIPLLMKFHKSRSESELMDKVLEIAFEAYQKTQKAKLKIQGGIRIRVLI